MAEPAENLKADELSAPLLQTLIFHVTGLCNLKCGHCWQSSGPDAGVTVSDKNSKGVSPRDFTAVIKDAKPLGLTRVKFTGGEPFIHPRINDYLEVVRRAGLAVDIETNGTLIEGAHIEELKRIDEGFVAISLDGATAKVHDRLRGVRGAFDRTIGTIRRLTRSGISVQIITALYRENLEDLAAVVKLAGEYGVGSVKINPIHPMGRGRNLFKHDDVLSVVELLETETYCREDLGPQYDGTLYFSLPMALKPFLDIQEHKFSLCGIFRILGLMPNGDLSFCGIGNLARAMVIGNIYKDSLPDLWENAPLLADLRQQLPGKLKGICARCIFKAVCLGECRAQTFDRTKDLMEGYWLCQEAYEAGLFPESRLLSLPAKADLREARPRASVIGGSAGLNEL